MKGLLDVLGLRAERRSFEHSAVGWARESGGMSIKKDTGRGMMGMGERGGVLFLPPNETFD